jgi:hypothetical protein
MTKTECWTVEELPRTIVDAVRGHKLSRSEQAGVLVRLDGRAVKWSLSDEDLSALAMVWQAAGLPLEPLTQPLVSTTAIPYLEAFNESPNRPSWELGFIARADARPEQAGAMIDEQKVRDALREAIESGEVVPRWPGLMVKAKPHEVGCASGLVLTAADLERLGLPVPKRLDLMAPEPSTQPVPMPEAVAPAPAGADDEAKQKDTPQLLNWKMRVQVAAAERWERLRALNTNPTVSSILSDMVKWCRENEVCTDGGITPSEGYLRTHVLGGKHWTPPTLRR